MSLESDFINQLIRNKELLSGIKGLENLTPNKAKESTTAFDGFPRTAIIQHLSCYNAMCIFLPIERHFKFNKVNWVSRVIRNYMYIYV